MSRSAVPTPVASALAARLGPVLAKRAGLALALYGEAGVGKSTTALEVLRQVSCRSASAHAARAAELLRGLPRPSRLPLWAQRTLERLEGGEHLESARAADALASYLAALSPVVLHLEDLHEAPAEGLELYTALAARVRRSRGIALLATSRTSPPAPFEACRVEPLSAEAARALMGLELGATPPEAAAAWIYARTLGNPLFTLEYLRYLTRQGYVWSDAQRWHWREPPKAFMPVTVEALIERAIEQAALSHAAREALAAAAILPVEAPISLWPGVAALPEAALASVQRELEHWGLFEQGAFAHPLYREVVLHDLTPARRRELARRALSALAGDPLTAAAFIEDAGVEAEEARALLERAASTALASGLELRAARFLARCVPYAVGRDRASLALRAAKALQDADLAEAARLAALAAELQPEWVEAVYLAAELTAQQGRMAEAEALLTRLPEHLSASETRWITLIRLRLKLRDRAGAIALWAEHPELHATRDVDFLCDIALALSVLGDRKQALALVERAFTQLEPTTLQRCRLLNILAGCHYLAGEQARAELVWSEALALAQATGNLRWIANTRLNRSFVGSNDQALCDLEHAAQLFAELGDVQSHYHAKNYLGQAYIVAAEYLKAEDTLLECREFAARQAWRSNLFLSELHLSALYHAWEPPYGEVLALKHARAALELALQLGNPAYKLGALAQLAMVEMRQGNAARGLELADEVLALATELDQPTELCDAYVAKALALEALEHPEEALRVLREAKRVAVQRHLVMEAPLLDLEIARLTGDVDLAAEQLAYFESQGFHHRANLARRYFPLLARADLPSEGLEARGRVLPPLRLELLGPMRLMREGVSVAVHGHKRKELLARLLEARVAGREEVPQLELLDALYPGEPEDAAAGALKQLVFQLRKSLGQGVVLRTGSGYALGEATSDVEAFLQDGATQLWRGSYREDLPPGDENVTSALHHALRLKAAERLHDDPREAARLGQLLLRADPYDAEALRLTLRALQASGDKRALERLYEQGRKQFFEVGEVLPEGWGSFLADRPL